MINLGKVSSETQSGKVVSGFDPDGSGRLAI